MASRLPLEDVKILDFMWVMAGPAGTRMLADYGAVIVRIESPNRVDTARTLGPSQNNTPGPDASGLFSNCNAGKFGITLDLGNPNSRDVVFDLVRWADVVTESFSPKAMRAWGFDYESLRKVKPDIIMLSTCLMGQSGPLSRIAGFGNMAAAISGFHNLTGWPDRKPAGPFGAYTDYVAPRFSAMALLGALDHHRRTGEGQYIDQSQAESALHFLTPAILDYTVNGRIESRAGNSDPRFAPHGVYPARGDDQWVAVVCTSDAQWRALASAMKRDSLRDDPRYATAAARLERREVEGEVGALLAGLVAACDGWDAFLPESGGPRGLEPLCAVYGPGCRAPVPARSAGLFAGLEPDRQDFGHRHPGRPPGGPGQERQAPGQSRRSNPGGGRSRGRHQPGHRFRLPSPAGLAPQPQPGGPPGG